MTVHAISSTQITRSSPTLARANLKPAKASPMEATRTGTRETAELAPVSAESMRTGKSGRAHGVLRLLAEGHFKAVPEARLRANFADLLPAAGNATTPDAQPSEPRAEELPADTPPVEAGPSITLLGGCGKEPVQTTLSVNLLA